MSHKRVAEERLLALPSVSRSLCSLQYATDMAGVAIHPHMVPKRAAQSEEKVRARLTSIALLLRHAYPAHFISLPLSISSETLCAPNNIPRNRLSIARTTPRPLYVSSPHLCPPPLFSQLSLDHTVPFL
ncbi:hypothetical protein BOTBODRAFT_241547 [Botryobasidium botryosum FD-172 SS1]|uniref:Uncharacterized protein n=1 Tax=Botryobasidium botryosum (strain FD-172 SS1) TaxID=930990 RepID=A0A067MYA0_BOTB1|nr:hypothetical protein BOTBODRAFT_241547 [Botryobasidium botryosum FD-172 SS1]